METLALRVFGWKFPYPLSAFFFVLFVFYEPFLFFFSIFFLAVLISDPQNYRALLSHKEPMVSPNLVTKPFQDQRPLPFLIPAEVSEAERPVYYFVYRETMNLYNFAEYFLQHADPPCPFVQGWEKDHFFYLYEAEDEDRRFHKTPFALSVMRDGVMAIIIRGKSYSVLKM